MTGMGRAGFFKICGEAATTTLGPEGSVKLKNPPAEGRSILRTFPFCTTLLHNLRHPPRPFVPKGRKNPLNPAAKRPLIKELL